MLKELITLLSSQSDFFINLIVQHLEISLISIFLAIIIGLSLGLFISEYPKNKWILTLVNLIYTIPSIALFGFLIPYTGVGNTSAIIALTVYGLLPMVRNTYTGIKTIDKGIIEAAEGMGSTDKQILFKIKLPLALPHIMSAIRNMTVMTIALAGIASFIGAGGLGVAIYRGITTNNMTLIIAGSLLITVLAIGIDLILGQIEKITAITYKKPKFFRYFKNRKVILSIGVICILIIGVFAYEENPGNTVHIASKSYTEEYIMGEILKQVIEANTNVHVELTAGIAGGTGTIHTGLEKGDFDMYPEYTGVAWMSVLKKTNIYDETMFNQLESEYNHKYNMTWLNKYGFEDTYGIAVTKEVADKYNLKTYSDLAPYSDQLTFGAESDFYAREDGYTPLCEKYGFNFKDTMDLDVSLKYDAVKQNQVDVIDIYTTDGRLQGSDLVILEDDQHFYPSYYGGTVIRQDTIQEHPEVKDAINMLTGKISTEEMRHMNYQVDVEKKDPSDVAHEFLKNKGLI